MDQALNGDGTRREGATKRFGGVDFLLWRLGPLPSLGLCEETLTLGGKRKEVKAHQQKRKLPTSRPSPICRKAIRVTFSPMRKRDYQRPVSCGRSAQRLGYMLCIPNNRYGVRTAPSYLATYWLPLLFTITWEATATGIGLPSSAMDQTANALPIHSRSWPSNPLLSLVPTPFSPHSNLSPPVAPWAVAASRNFPLSWAYGVLCCYRCFLINICSEHFLTMFRPEYLGSKRLDAGRFYGYIWREGKTGTKPSYHPFLFSNFHCSRLRSDEEDWEHECNGFHHEGTIPLSPALSGQCGNGGKPAVGNTSSSSLINLHTTWSSLSKLYYRDGWPVRAICCHPIFDNASDGRSSQIAQHVNNKTEETHQLQTLVTALTVSRLSTRVSTHFVLHTQFLSFFKTPRRLTVSTDTNTYTPSKPFPLIHPLRLWATAHKLAGAGRPKSARWTTAPTIERSIRKRATICTTRLIMFARRLSVGVVAFSPPGLCRYMCPQIMTMTLALPFKFQQNNDASVKLRASIIVSPRTELHKLTEHKHGEITTTSRMSQPSDTWGKSSATPSLPDPETASATGDTSPLRRIVPKDERAVWTIYPMTARLHSNSIISQLGRQSAAPSSRLERSKLRVRIVQHSSPIIMPIIIVLLAGPSAEFGIPAPAVTENSLNPKSKHFEDLYPLVPFSLPIACYNTRQQTMEQFGSEIKSRLRVSTLKVYIHTARGYEAQLGCAARGAVGEDDPLHRQFRTWQSHTECPRILPQSRFNRARQLQAFATVWTALKDPSVHVAAESEATTPSHWLCVGSSSKATSYHASFFKNVSLKYLVHFTAQSVLIAVSEENFKGSGSVVELRNGGRRQLLAERRPRDDMQQSFFDCCGLAVIAFYAAKRKSMLIE
ncbi:uncharacterized protein CLUP02_15249 [Colletotrichum lupini]|uniref:Uncharacterized protein n=1 Tax=Colletotrichum lupini TaxID=145971 RepID=A0A9Q8T6B5_9PEZI|nr:uncharacterized protein CLUP02_15249 [Colletotrichum lupini]UQC89718.1 hypothetical protein CLUP02_15249 [Colletotrichum lupini]